MVIILIISLLIQIAMLIWFGKWAILIMAIGVIFIMALAWWETAVSNRGQTTFCAFRKGERNRGLSPINPPINPINFTGGGD